MTFSDFTISSSIVLIVSLLRRAADYERRSSPATRTAHLFSGWQSHLLDNFSIASFSQNRRTVLAEPQRSNISSYPGTRSFESVFDVLTSSIQFSETI
ncbi:hypothetical protein M6B38_159635 [Iris pallida]|uniref:Secreted protein n=1 Tax=Iris pallida TaxID=29817 RepID=A0AAX6F0E9_IRIPA|nr:hypothetical protein M6B38_159635 [Iris pallida]